MRRLTMALMGAFLLVSGTGCAMMQSVDWLGRESTFTDTYKLYTRLVRWGEFERASAYVEPADRDAYRNELRALGKLHITDYEVDKPIYDRLAQTATVHVRYEAYRPETLESIAFTEVQRWTRDLETGDWRVDHEGSPLVAAQSVGLGR